MFKYVIVFIILLSLCECMRKNVCKTIEDYRTIEHNPNCWYNPDVGASPVCEYLHLIYQFPNENQCQGEIIKGHGYPFESYEIVTKDGYILTLFRVPHNGSNFGEKKQVVFLQHGLSVDSSCFLYLGAQSSGT